MCTARKNRPLFSRWLVSLKSNLSHRGDAIYFLATFSRPKTVLLLEYRSHLHVAAASLEMYFMVSKRYFSSESDNRIFIESVGNRFNMLVISDKMDYNLFDLLAQTLSMRVRVDVFVSSFFDYLCLLYISSKRSIVTLIHQDCTWTCSFSWSCL